jgi:TRAP-type transport system periplasmic protein
MPRNTCRPQIARFLILMLLGVAFLLQPAASQPNAAQPAAKPAEQAAPIKWTIAVENEPSNSWAKVAHKFAELTTQRSNGRMKVEAFDSGALGFQREVLEGMRTGTMQGTVTLEPMSYWARDVAIWGIPYLFESRKHLDAFLASPVNKEFNDKLIAAGFRPVSYLAREPRNMTSNRPINSIADLKGLKIRVPESRTAPPAFTAMGLKVVTMPYTEVYQALKQGVIDMQENPMAIAVSGKLYEVQKYMALTEHQLQIAYFVISEQAFQKLPKDLQDMVLQAGVDAQAFERDITKVEWVEARASLEKAGMKFTTPGLAPFREAAATAYANYDPEIKEWIAKIRAISH